MTVSRESLEKFNGKKVHGITYNIKCAEDVDEIRQSLMNKYGAGAVVEEASAFIVNGKNYMKPWVPRERVGIFRVAGNYFYLDIQEGSMAGYRVPRRRINPLSTLSIKNENTLIFTIDAQKDFRIEYTLIEGE